MYSQKAAQGDYRTGRRDVPGGLVVSEIRRRFGGGYWRNLAAGG
jgi:hypothetical protein